MTATLILTILSLILAFIVGMRCERWLERRRWVARGRHLHAIAENVFGLIPKPGESEEELRERMHQIMRTP